MVHDRADKSVAASRKGLDEARFVCFVRECAPQLLYCGIQTMLKVHKSIFGPQPLAKFFAGHELAGMFEQHREDAKRLFLEFDFPAALEKFARTQVQSVDVES